MSEGRRRSDVEAVGIARVFVQRFPELRRVDPQIVAFYAELVGRMEALEKAVAAMPGPADEVQDEAPVAEAVGGDPLPFKRGPGRPRKVV